MRRTYLALLALVVSAVGLGFNCHSLPIYPSETSEEFRFGWAGPDAVRLTSAWAQQQPNFQLIAPDGRPVWQDNAKANVRLWKLVEAASGKIYQDNIPQAIGDCTSKGGAHAIEATQGCQIGSGKQLATWRRIDPTFLYAAARVWILNGQLRGDGATGGSIARAAKEYGVVAADAPGVPAYSARRAREWGAQGPPESLRALAMKSRIKTVALMRSAVDVRDAVCNGYGVLICSSWGSEKFSPHDGRIVATRSTTWMHAMCVDGYDGSTGNAWYHITNSWGPSAHPQPIDDSPPGGFWVGEQDMAFIISQGDSWALSDFDGFPTQDLNLNLFGDKETAAIQKRHIKTHRKRELAL